MSRVLYPGSFDPVHVGHVELVETAVSLFDEVLVATLSNPRKGDGVFSLDERMDMLRETFAHLSGVSVTMFSGLVVDLARAEGCDIIVKGLRSVSDVENELQMAQMNNEISGVQTVFIPSASSYSFLASSLIREVARFGGDVSSMVPPSVAKRLKERFADA